MAVRTRESWRKREHCSCHSIMTQPNSARREIIDMVRTVAIGLTAAVAIQTVAFQPYTIPSASMEPGLVTGDYLVVSKFAYGWSRASLPFNPPLSDGTAVRPDAGARRRGRLPPAARPAARSGSSGSIGLPGDRVQVIGGAVVVNGAAVPQRSLGPARRPRRARLAGRTGARSVSRTARAYVTFDGGAGLERRRHRRLCRARRATIRHGRQPRQLAGQPLGRRRRRRPAARRKPGRPRRARGRLVEAGRGPATSPGPGSACGRGGSSDRSASGRRNSIGVRTPSLFVSSPCERGLASPAGLWRWRGPPPRRSRCRPCCCERRPGASPCGGASQAAPGARSCRARPRSRSARSPRQRAMKAVLAACGSRTSRVSLFLGGRADGHVSDHQQVCDGSLDALPRSVPEARPR